MRHMRIALAAMMILTAATAFSKKHQDKQVYAFGVSASFTDTLVYYTDIHIIDSVSLDKSGFLPNREMYSYQLKEYLENEYKQKNGTCMIYFNEKKKKLDKEFSKLMAKYKKNNSIVMIAIPQDKFKFKEPDLGEE